MISSKRLLKSYIAPIHKVVPRVGCIGEVPVWEKTCLANLHGFSVVRPPRATKLPRQWSRRDPFFSIVSNLFSALLPSCPGLHFSHTRLQAAVSTLWSALPAYLATQRAHWSDNPNIPAIPKRCAINLPRLKLASHSGFFPTPCLPAQTPFEARHNTIDIEITTKSCGMIPLLTGLR